MEAELTTMVWLINNQGIRPSINHGAYSPPEKQGTRGCFSGELPHSGRAGRVARGERVQEWTGDAQHHAA